MRLVELRDVSKYRWALRPLAWGLDTETGEHVGFAVSTREGAALLHRLETEDRPLVDVHDLDVLFVRPAPGAAETASA